VEVHSKVYASPNQTQLSCTADSREELPEKPDICWPDISFAVSNFEEEFESMVPSFLPVPQSMGTSHSTRQLAA